MKPILIYALLSLSAHAAEPKTPPAVAAGRYYGSAKVLNALISNKQKNATYGIKYGEESRMAAMFYTSMNYIDIEAAGKELIAAAAALPAKPSPDVASKTLLALADQELAQAEKISTETMAMVESARVKITQNYRTAPPSETRGIPSVSMLLDMLSPRPVPIAQARAAAAGKR